ncbi:MULTISPECIES: hypothetical protein [Methylobacterium]|uniref:hypothetical protein n=1 Tax=Methylobacterium TaxID=407 RepID=UPI001051D14D|nr:MULTISPECIES: hypothetical protein [Methylobacterium]MDR7039302.1 hypothetical protein [Methylobacterium sp. BE186]
MLVRTVSALLLTTAAAVAAPGGATSADRSELKRSCTGDYFTYCGDLEPDSPEVQACFRQNKAKLSPNCQSAISAYTKGQKRG